MVTSNIDSNAKMSRQRRGRTSSNSSGFRLLDEQCDTVSSVSRNSIYKQKIDSMFDDSRSIISQHIDDRNSVRSDRKSASNRGSSVRSSRYNYRSQLQNVIEDDVQRVSNTVQAQIERMFTDVIKDTTSCSFPVKCLGSLPLRDKVTSLVGLQEPLRKLYLTGAGHSVQNGGTLDICASGMRVKFSNGQDMQMTPFHHIAVWSAVKFIVSAAEGGAAFLPLITDPENIDKRSLFSPLSAADRRRLSSSLHAPIFAVVMRSIKVQRQLECHAYVCQTPEDAIVIAATLYQSLMAHMGNSQNEKPRKPRNQNGVSCISIASSSVANGRYNENLTKIIQNKLEVPRHKPPPVPSRPPRKKRSASSSISGESDVIRDAHIQTTTEERKKKSHKTRRAPPVPGTQQNDQIVGDILTRVAIPRSGSFLNTSGLARYKSRATRRPSKPGGGGGSPLGFSELFNEFRLQENLHSLDDILNAIINSDGMSFNDLKPIYKEFLLKLAVTLTKDELYQRSKSIMRRQKKKKLRRTKSMALSHRKGLILGSKSLKKVFSKFRSKSVPVKYSKSVAENLEKTKKIEHNITGTSSSDVSEPRNEHNINQQNRNSSSGYVSCSECSYDSEACTCTSADRCYCSLGADHDNVNTKLTKSNNRDSLFSCNTEDKCYCSISESNCNESDTTWCDSDSCISASKCYCKGHKDANTHRLGYKKDNLALDYELFTIGGGGGKHVEAHEALSVKKSVEMAALFADVRLSQTTDITSIITKNRNNKMKCENKKGSVKSNSSEVVLRKKNVDHFNKIGKNDEIYQALPRPVSATLEDSLGYLP
ncbi:hypothetical protein Bhyg_16364 [Pseudolycoriella hygida]|uniref:PID domain-containing protein n=1 Tax=Pseudolycoriella hygida TaxID=35572 RepID=A0A9Q0MIZ5_9DIPT|nr:hypothetical protein Bhyg_16364 [Pseudolycoriella hygida]